MAVCVCLLGWLVPIPLAVFPGAPNLRVCGHGNIPRYTGMHVGSRVGGVALRSLHATIIGAVLATPRPEHVSWSCPPLTASPPLRRSDTR